MSAKTEHTPGPWHRNIRANGKYPVVFASRSRHVATVCQQVKGAETEANIDLIATAPELLEALEYAAREIKAFYDAAAEGRINTTVTIGQFQRLAAINAVTARARGEA